MKQLIALVAAVATASVFAQTKPAEAPKTTPAASAPAASAPAAKADATKSEAKPAAKKDDKKAAAPAKK